jgi:hypothetical protein
MMPDLPEPPGNEPTFNVVDFCQFSPAMIALLSASSLTSTATIAPGTPDPAKTIAAARQGTSDPARTLVADVR